MEPEDGYFRDLAVFLGFRMARSELDLADTIDETDIAADLLWRTAPAPNMAALPMRGARLKKPSGR
ncbi:MAG: hypothetical protein R3C16_12315 [Hyphomonadaceae bacterium]